MRSIRHQEFPDIEIIVVDDGSTDNTVEIAKRAGVEVLSLSGNLGAPCAQNRGIERASGEVIFTLDADAEIPRKIIKKAVEALASSRCDVVGGIYRSRSHNSISHLYELYMRSFHFLPHDAICSGQGKGMPFGAFLGFKRNVFEKEKFDENIRAGYDAEFLIRLAKRGFRILYSPELYVYHPNPSSLRAIVKRTWTFGIWSTVIGRRHPRLLLQQKLALPAISLIVLALSLSGFLIVLPPAISLYYLKFLFHSLRKRSTVGSTRLQVLAIAGLAMFIAILNAASFPAALFYRPKHWKNQTTGLTSSGRHLSDLE